MQGLYNLVCVTHTGRCKASYITHLASRSLRYRAPKSSQHALKLFMNVDLETEVNRRLSICIAKTIQQSVGKMKNI